MADRIFLVSDEMGWKSLSVGVVAGVVVGSLAPGATTCDSRLRPVCIDCVLAVEIDDTIGKLRCALANRARPTPPVPH